MNTDESMRNRICVRVGLPVIPWMSTKSETVFDALGEIPAIFSENSKRFLLVDLTLEEILSFLSYQQFVSTILQYREHWKILYLRKSILAWIVVVGILLVYGISKKKIVGLKSVQNCEKVKTPPEWCLNVERLVFNGTVVTTECWIFKLWHGIILVPLPTQLLWVFRKP